MTALMEGIGESILKTVLHHAITIPLQSGLQQMFKQVNQLSQSSGGGGGFLGLFSNLLGLFGGLFGGGSSFAPGSATGYEADFFAKGGLVLAGAGASSNVPHMLVNRYNIPKLAQGAIVKGPTLAVLGEGGEDEFVIPKSKMQKMMGGNGEGSAPNVKVEINGDITPRKPDMKPEDVVRVIVDNGMRTSNSGVGAMVTSIVKRIR